MDREHTTSVSSTTTQARSPLTLVRRWRRRFSISPSKLHDFQGVDLEVHRRLANLGEKTFRYEKGGESHETTFNYTLDMNAAQLLDLFEGFRGRRPTLLICSAPCATTGSA